MYKTNRCIYDYIKYMASNIKHMPLNTSDGIRIKHYYLLLLLLINSECTYEALLPLVALIKPDDVMTFKKISDMYVRTFSKDITYGTEPLTIRAIGINKAKYKTQAATAKLTTDGFRYLLYLHNSIEWIKNASDVDEEVLRTWRTSNNKSAGDHSLQNLAVLSTVSANVDYMDLLIEGGRGADYQPIKMGRNTGAAFYADFSCMIYEGPYTPLIFETDLETERVKRLTDKAFLEITYAYNNARKYKAQPGITVFVVGENESLAPKRKSKKEYRKSNEAYYSELLDNPASMALIAGVTEALRLYHKEKNAETIITPRCFFELPDINHNLNGLLNEYVAELIKYSRANGLYDNDVADICEQLLETSKKAMTKAEINKDRYEERQRAFEQRVRNKRFALYKGMKEVEGAENIFAGGEGLFVLSYPALKAGLKSILPEHCGAGNVRAVLDAIGLTEQYSKYWTCRPLLFDHHRNDYVNLRNCFLVTGVYVFFEDISFDVGAIDRIREYLSLPSDFIYNTMLVIIIDDDEILANGKSLADYNIYAEYGIPNTDQYGRTYKDAFVECYGESGALPYKYRKTNDFCFIRRSEYLAGEEVHPYIRLGSNVFVERTFIGFNDDTRLINFNKGGTHYKAERFAHDFKRYTFN